MSLTALRAAPAPALLVIAYRGGSHFAFGFCLLAAFLSDVFDGILARRLGVAALGSDNASTSIAIYAGILADLEGLAISLILPTWQADVPTLIHAFVRRPAATTTRLPEKAM